MSEWGRNKWLWLSLTWFVAAIYALFFKQGGGAAPFAHFDKVAHFGLFFGQFWLLSKIFLHRQQTPPWRWLLLAALVWAGLSEYLQATLTPDRHGDVFDTIADVLGAACALWLAVRVAQASPQIKETS